MQEVIKISDKEIVLSNNISWALEYRDQFGSDIIQDHIPLLETITEALASVIGENGTNGIDVADIVSSLEGRTMDIMLPMMQTRFMELFVNVTWAMAKAADEDIDPPKKWVRQFDTFPLDIIVPTIYDLAFKGFVSSKNLKRLTALKDEVVKKKSQP